tara:strand:- start:862 stop:1017 length:156 start_codon:yes stop_codon:yes gene_type:complete
MAIPFSKFLLVLIQAGRYGKGESRGLQALPVLQVGLYFKHSSPVDISANLP